MAGHAFQVGGAVQRSSLYVERSIDLDLYSKLARGEYCYILAPRQIGKSSLRVRTKWNLEQNEIRCATIDLNQIGGAGTNLDEWFFGIVFELARELGLGNAAEQFWEKASGTPTVHRWIRFLREVVLNNESKQTVIFIDEIDALLSNDGKDDFLASIRSCFDRRPDEKAYELLTFCLIGVALPTDLVTDPRRTPFNLGHFLTINDFSRKELDSFRPAIAGPPVDVTSFLDSVYKWTLGNPYMTQKLCLRLIERRAKGRLPTAQQIDDCVVETFVENWHADSNLAFTDQFFTVESNPTRCRAMLELYETLIRGNSISVDESSSPQVALRLSGIAAIRKKDRDYVLQVRNPIFERVFNQAWLTEKTKEFYVSAPLQKWQRAGRNISSLLLGEELQKALELKAKLEALSEEEEEFVGESYQHSKTLLKTPDDISESEKLSVTPWTALTAVLYESPVLTLKTEWSHFLKTWSAVGHVHNDFKVCTTEIVSFFQELEIFCRRLESEVEPLGRKDRERALLRYQEVFGAELTSFLNSLFGRLDELASFMPSSALAIHENFLRHHLHPYILNCPFVLRAYSKPLGYAGDYETINMLFRDGFVGQNLFAKMVNAWALSHPIAQAYRSRSAIFAEAMASSDNLRYHPARVRVLATGASFEDIRASLARPTPRLRAEITILDFNDATLQFLRNSAGQAIAQTPHDITMRFVKKSVQMMLMERATQPVDRYHLIYCAGLSDYLPDGVVRRLIQMWFESLMDDGCLVLVNLNFSRHQFVWESILEWHTILRGFKELAKLIPENIVQYASFPIDHGESLTVLKLVKRSQIAS
jgi:hypothetical protein